MSSKPLFFAFNTAKFSTAASKPSTLAKRVYEDDESEDCSKTPIVVLHGFLGSQHNWYGACKNLFKALSGKRKLIAVDLRNHGDSPHFPTQDYVSMTGDIKTLVEELEFEKVAFIGHSMGGKTAMAYTLTYVMFYCTTKDLGPLPLAYTVHEAKHKRKEKRGTPVLILHGLFSSKDHWAEFSENLTEEMRPQRQVIAVDLRNHGDSPHHELHCYRALINDLKALIDRLKVPMISLLGHCTGGKTAMRYTLKYPDTVSQLIVGDIAPMKYRQVKLLDHILNAMMNVKLPTHVDKTTASVIVNKQLKRKIKSKQTRQFLLMNLIGDKDGGYRWKYNLPVLNNSVKTILEWPDLKGVFDKPVLFVAGGESNMISPEDEPMIRTYFPRAEIVRIEGANHNIHMDKPHEFVEVCAKYLNQE